MVLSSSFRSLGGITEKALSTMQEVGAEGKGEDAERRRLFGWEVLLIGYVPALLSVEER